MDRLEFDKFFEQMSLADKGEILKAIAYSIVDGQGVLKVIYEPITDKLKFKCIDSVDNS